jgi:hypothetical protein
LQNPVWMFTCCLVDASPRWRLYVWPDVWNEFCIGEACEEDEEDIQEKVV